MEHLRFDLGNLKKGSTVAATMDNQANVQLMTSSDYSNYKARRRYRYLGGRVTRSPFRITVPSSGHWVVLGGQTWDVFISHASENKAAVARPLRDALTRMGISVLLNEAQMRIGRSLRRKIDDGIRSSRFGVVILSEECGRTTSSTAW